MAISYPVQIPSTIAPSSFVLRSCDATAMSVSPFTMAQQVYRHQGQYWEADVAFPPLVRADAYAVIAALDSLKGSYGTLVYGDPLHTAPVGTGSGTPRVSGTNAIRSETLATKGWSAGSAVLKAGDLFQLGSGSTTRLYRNLKDVSADGSGNATLDIWPALRAVAADSDTITVTLPQGIWRLADPHRAYSAQVGQYYAISFSLREAL